MHYGGVIQDEMEVTIRLDRADRQAHICSSWPEWSRKLERLYGSPKRVTERAGKVTSAFWVIPLNRVSLRRSPRILTETQRRAAAARRRRAKERLSALTGALSIRDRSLDLPWVGIRAPCRRTPAVGREQHKV
jgi:hypothetical protein